MVLIKNMEKPETCDKCRLADYTFLECKVTHRKIGAYVDNEQIPKWCPLTEVESYGPEGTLYKEK